MKDQCFHGGLSLCCNDGGHRLPATRSVQQGTLQRSATLERKFTCFQIINTTRDAARLEWSNLNSRSVAATETCEFDLSRALKPVFAAHSWHLKGVITELPLPVYADRTGPT
jgi:hypothetical protein